jgi:hypothetical protein
MSSSYGINVPQADEINYHEDLAWQRRQRVLKALDVSDVLAEVDDLVAQEVDPRQHPCYSLAAFLLDQQQACDGGQLYDRWRALCLAAIDRLIEQRLQGED